MAKKSVYKSIKAYKTKDGSKIRELMHPDIHKNFFGVKNQSLAEATIAMGEKTRMHSHGKSEELYYFSRGSGIMTLGEKQFEVSVGDTVCVPPGTPHCVENTGDSDLVILCCCSPPYDHQDTTLL